MTIDSSLLTVEEYHGEGYQPLVDYDQWRVAVLNYCNELLPTEINKVQKHNKTDEVFILLQGQCILFIAEGHEQVENIKAIDMKPLKLYNIKKSTWHTHTLSKDAVVAIVENQNTCLDNSPEKKLTEKQKEKIERLTKSLWS